MIILGLTGSIGMGKSTVAKMFRVRKIPVYDADKTVHELYGNEAISQIQDLFPKAVVKGKINRKILGDIVLSDKKLLLKLENIIHPLVFVKRQEFLDKSRTEGHQLVVLNIPLLFETGADKHVDVIVVVTANFEEQKKRVLSRLNMDEEKFMQILKHQLPDEQKRLNADFVIDTQLGINETRRQVVDIINYLQSSNGKFLHNK